MGGLHTHPRVGQREPSSRPCQRPDPPWSAQLTVSFLNTVTFYFCCSVFKGIPRSPLPKALLVGPACWLGASGLTPPQMLWCACDRIPRHSSPATARCSYSLRALSVGTQSRGAHTHDITCQGINASGAFLSRERTGLGHLDPRTDLCPSSGTCVCCSVRRGGLFL